MNPPAEKPTPILRVIALATLVAGTLDISDALIFYGLRGIPPTRILQGIAYALIGRTSYLQGARSAALGLFLHFFIKAATVSTIYILASRRLPLSRHPILYGTLYGLGVYIVMNYVVVPFSRIGLRPLPHPVPLINAVAALIFCIGIPIAYIASRYIPITETAS